MHTEIFEPVQSDLVIARHPFLAEYEQRQREGKSLPPRLGGGAFQTWETLINAYQVNSTTSGTALKESTTLTDISPGAAVSGQALTIPAGFVVAGNILRYTARGFFTNTATPTLTLGLYWGGVAGKALAERKVTMASVTAESSWTLEATTRIVKAEEKGKAMTQGIVIGMLIAEAESTGVTVVNIPITKPQTEIEINTAVANILTLGAKWGSSSASNTITCSQWLVEILN